LNWTSSFSSLGGVSDVLNLANWDWDWDWDMAQGRLRVEVTKLQRLLRHSGQCSNIYSHFKCTLTRSKRESQHTVGHLAGHHRQGLWGGAPPSSQFFRGETWQAEPAKLSPPRNPAQLSLVSSFGLRVQGAQSAWKGKLSQGKTSLTRGQSPSGKASSCKRESLDPSVLAPERGRTLESGTLLCPL
jgi:hypothetical protein